MNGAWWMMQVGTVGRLMMQSDYGFKIGVLFGFTAATVLALILVGVSRL